jgi:Transposase DDE domain group 1
MDTRAAANQFRLFLHAAAYWLLWSMRSKRSSWRTTQFDTLRLLKLAARGRDEAPGAALCAFGRAVAADAALPAREHAAVDQLSGRAGAPRLRPIPSTASARRTQARPSRRPAAGFARSPATAAGVMLYSSIRAEWRCIIQA